MLPSRLKTRPNSLLKLSAMSLVVATLSGCGEDAKDCGGFWDKTFGREECVVALPAAALVPQLPLGENVVQNTFKVATEAQQVLAGQTLKVMSLIDTPTGLNGQVKTDAQADIISVMRGDEILLMQPVLDGQPQTSEVSFESTALQIVLMDVKFSGSDVATRKRVIDKIRQHAKFSTLVAQVKLAVTSGVSNPLDAMNSPYIYETADEIISEVSIGEPVVEQSAAVSVLSRAYGLVAATHDAVISPANADSTVFQGREHMSAAIQLSKEDKKPEINFNNKSMVAYAVYDANGSQDNFRIVDPSEKRLKADFGECVVKVVNKFTGVKEEINKVPTPNKCIKLEAKSTVITLNDIIATENQQKTYQQLNLIGGSALWRGYSGDFLDNLNAMLNPTQPRGLANWYNALTFVDIATGLASKSAKSMKDKNGETVKASKKFVEKLERSKKALKALSFFFDVSHEVCDSIVKTVTSNDATINSNPNSVMQLKSTCEYLRVGKELSTKVSSIYGSANPSPEEKAKKKKTMLLILYKVFLGEDAPTSLKDLPDAGLALGKPIALEIIKLINTQDWATIQKNWKKGIEASTATIETLDGATTEDLDRYMMLAGYLVNGSNDTLGVIARASAVANGLLSDPEVVKALQVWVANQFGANAIGVYQMGYKNLTVKASQRGFVKKYAGGAVAVIKGFEIGEAIGNQALPFAWDMLVTPPEMSITLVNGKISNIPAHQPSMTLKVNGVVKYDYRQRQDAATLHEPVEVQEGDMIDIEYSAIQPSVYSNDGTPDLAHDADGVVLVDKYKIPTKMHSFAALVTNTEGQTETIHRGLLCVRNPVLGTTQFAYSNDLNEQTCGGNDKGAAFFTLNGKDEKSDSFQASPVFGAKNHTVNYAVRHQVTAQDAKLSILFDNYSGASSDSIQIGLKAHRQATATLAAIDDLGDGVDYIVYVGKEIQLKLVDISTAITDVVWSLFHESGAEVPLIDDNYLDFTTDDIVANEGKYTLRADMKDEYGYVIGSATKEIQGFALGFANATVSPTIMPVNQPVTIQVTGTDFTDTTVFALESAPCNTILRNKDINTAITTLTAVCTPSKLGDLKVTLKRKSGVDADARVFTVKAVATATVAGQFVVPAKDSSYFVPPVDNQPIFAPDGPIVMDYRGASRKNFQCAFTTTGKVKTYSSYPETDANGYSPDILRLLNDFPSMALIAQISGVHDYLNDRLLIGTAKNITLPAGDTLRFYANDDSYADNIGQFTVAYMCTEPKMSVQVSSNAPVAESTITFSLIDTVIENVKSVIWKVGENIFDTFASIADVFSYIFDKAGDYVISATVKDNNSYTILTTSTQVTVKAAPPVASLVGSAITGVAGQPVTFVLSNSAAKEGKLCSYLFNNGEGVDSGNTGCGDDGLPVIFLPITTTYTKAGTFTPTLTVTDSQGKSGTVMWLVNVSEAVQTVSTLTATGITTCGNASTNGLLCTLEALGALYGLGQDGEVQAGQKMSYSVLNQNGSECVKDNVTDLVWEQKTNDDGLRDKDWMYTWYNPNSSTNGGNAGTQNGGICYNKANGAQCDTQGYIQALNAANYCGYSDWRMPSDNELFSIVDYSRYSPSINPIFMNTQSSGYYWSASPDANRNDLAWGMYFENGITVINPRLNSLYVRAVRGSQ